MASRAVCGILVSSLALPVAVSAQDAVDLAARYIGRPYVWGAEGPNSFDCSGLTQHVFQQVGIDLPRRAISQSQVGRSVGSRLQRGDLVFFRNDPNASLTVTHVGIYEGGGMMINASKRKGRVLREALNEPYWSDRFMFARRVGSGVETSRDDRPVYRPEDEGIARRPSRSGVKRGAARAAGIMAEEILRRVIRRPR